MRRHLVAMAVGLAALALALGIRLLDPGLITEARLAVFDLYQRIQPRPYEPAPVRVIDLDDESLARLGQWPWPRTQIAQLVERLTAMGAAAIAFDVVFAEPDRTSPAEILPFWPDSPLLEQVRAHVGELPDHDSLFAQTIAQSPVVLGFALIGSSNEIRPARKAGINFLGSDPTALLQRFSGAVTDLPVLEQAAPGLGSISLSPSESTGGIIRRVPLLQTLDGRIYPTLTVEALRVAQGAGSIDTRAADASGEIAFGDTAGLNAVRIGGVVVPVTGGGELWVHYTRPVPERVVPAWRVFDDSVAARLAERIAGHIVLIGTSAQGLQDIRATPLNPFEPGVLVHAQALEQMILQRFLDRPDLADGVEILSILVLGLVLVWLLPRLGALACAVIAIVAIALGVGGSWYAFSELHWLFDPLYPSVAVLLVYLAMTVTVFLRTERERGRVRNAFSRYLSPTLVNRLADDPQKLVLGGEMRPLTLMFCDIRSFTKIAEGMGPHELIQFMNEYLTPMTDAILDRVGTIDKYMGDAIMAFWNAPLSDPDHARNACRAALEMRRRLGVLNRGWQEDAGQSGRNFPEIHFGIGLNTGEACVGNMGSVQRFDYSCLGDAVNLASRLEGQTKRYGFDIMLTETTQAAAPDFPVLEFDLLRVVGRVQPVRVYGLYDEPEAAAANGFGTLKQEHDAMIAAYRGRNWDGAQTALEAARSKADGRLEGFYALYAERIADYRRNPPPPGWDGVHIAEGK